MPINKPLTLIVDDIKDDTTMLARRVALGVHRDWVLGCPVDQGRARGSIGATLGRQRTAQAGTLDKSGGGTLSRGAGTIATAKFAQVIRVSSALSYMQKLEDGGSPQNRGFIKQAFLNGKLRAENG